MTNPLNWSGFAQVTALSVVVIVIMILVMIYIHRPRRCPNNMCYRVGRVHKISRSLDNGITITRIVELDCPIHRVYTVHEYWDEYDKAWRPLVTRL